MVLWVLKACFFGFFGLGAEFFHQFFRLFQSILPDHLIPQGRISHFFSIFFHNAVLHGFNRIDRAQLFIDFAKQAYRDVGDGSPVIDFFLVLLAHRLRTVDENRFGNQKADFTRWTSLFQKFGILIQPDLNGLVRIDGFIPQLLQQAANPSYLF
jgi:hypothetical protein